MSTKRLHWLGVLATVIAVITADQLTKWAMLAKVGIAMRPPIEVTSFFRLVMVWNYGVSFGMLAHGAAIVPWILVAVAMVICGLLVRLAFKTQIAAERVAYGLIIGGALGNVIDRLRFRAVADFFYFHIGDLGWPAFNVADSCIFLGVVTLLIMMVKHPSKP